MHMKPTIKINFVSDIGCPWCAVGLGTLEQATERLKDQADFEIHFEPFELNPQMRIGGENAIEYLGKKYGLSEQQVKANQIVNLLTLAVWWEMLINKKTKIQSLTELF